jgi:hypothetical protein
MPKAGTIRGIGWQNSEHPPGFWGMGRSSEMKNKADFEQILEVKMPFNGRNGRKIEAFWQLGRVEMRAIPFGGLKRRPLKFRTPFLQALLKVEMRAIPFGGLKPGRREATILGHEHSWK